MFSFLFFIYFFFFFTFFFFLRKFANKTFDAPKILKIKKNKNKKTSGEDRSDGLEINNVYIHDLIANPLEHISTQTTRNLFQGPIPFNFVTQNGFTNPYQSYYVGDPLTDCVVGLAALSQNWWYLGRTLITTPMLNWIQSGLTMSEYMEYAKKNNFEEISRPEPTCNMDIGGHSPKGAVGIRFERTVNAVIANVKIENIYNIAELGSTICGEYIAGCEFMHCKKTKSFCFCFCVMKIRLQKGNKKQKPKNKTKQVTKALVQTLKQMQYGCLDTMVILSKYILLFFYIFLLFKINIFCKKKQKSETENKTNSNEIKHEKTKTKTKK